MTLLKKIICSFLFLSSLTLTAQQTSTNNSTNKHQSFQPGEVWTDNNGVHINAHGGGILYYNNKYYWFGEYKSENSNQALVGVTCYSSADLYNWTNEGVVLPVVENNENSPIAKECIIERPKVIHNPKTGKFVMYFHLELKDKGYASAYTGIAVSDSPTGTYQLVKASRVNPKHWAVNMTEQQRKSTVKPDDFEKWWTPEWVEAAKDGLFTRRDFNEGQMARDMTLFVDDNGKAYHIYASEENLTLQIAELTADYLAHTGKYIRVAPTGHNEAPAVFKKNGRYYMITSGCTGWAPNAARLLVADSIMGNWQLYPNPCVGADADLTFNSQSTFILPVAGKNDAFIFMADRWNPKHPIDGRYVWLPIQFENGLPVLKWIDEWTLDFFDTPKTVNHNEDWQLVWSDEFNYNGQPNPDIWSHEQGFVRNNELQWYQPQNAICKNGMLTIYGKKEQVKNPNYEKNSTDWRKNRKYANYTASSIKTKDTKEFLYGRIEVRAKIPTAIGSWPAIWTLGNAMPWPSCGEIDILEYYQINNQPHILANTAWGTDKPYNAKWNSTKLPFSQFTDNDPDWANKFHIWRMDWDEAFIRLYVDDVLVNETDLSQTQNGSIGEYKNPFRQPHYLLLNLAIGSNGGTPNEKAFPLIYEIDYVRVYQKK